MSERKPLVLIADDVKGYREEMLPQLCKDLKADFITARDVHSAVQQALDHTGDSERPLDLIILDMHMPVDADHIVEVYAEAGIKVLQNLRLRPPACSVVIFTAYPSFHNCVKAVKAGATAYVSKLRRGDEGGPEELFAVCRDLLFPPAAEAHPQVKLPTTDAWMQINYQWLVRELSGKWISLVTEGALKAALADVKSEDSTTLLKAASADAKSRDGLTVLSGDTYDSVRRLVASSPALYLEYPPILRVARGTAD